ncbi:MAG TPA: RdgB/HAM1 family non-canonical purine NTP pyrophosphatase [Parasegetibacter sp.]
METLIFATNNQHKVDEIRAVVGPGFEMLTLKEAGILVDIPEPHDTLEENAREKSRFIYKMTGKSCFSEDTGLEVEALNGEPGVNSARYAGEDKSFEKNMEKLLKNLEGVTNRKARFRTVISLIRDGVEHQFEGICEGTIARAPSGTGGFGYDPVFIPEGETRSFAEMSAGEKHKISHRTRAVEQLVNFLTL